MVLLFYRLVILHPQHWIMQESVYVLHLITCHRRITPPLAELLFAFFIDWWYYRYFIFVKILTYLLKIKQFQILFCWWFINSYISSSHRIQLLHYSVEHFLLIYLFSLWKHCLLMLCILIYAFFSWGVTKMLNFSCWTADCWPDQILTKVTKILTFSCRVADCWPDQILTKWLKCWLFPAGLLTADQTKYWPKWLKYWLFPAGLLTADQTKYWPKWL